jgi:hypothetical protein
MSTILEILDERDPHDTPHNLALITAAATLSPECGHVHNDGETKRKIPCRICGTICDMRQSFFGLDERGLLEMIFESYSTENSRSVCVILFCTMMELHLHTFLVNRCRRAGLDWPIIDLLLESNSRLGDRLKLFEKICGCKPEDALAGTEVIDVFSAWRSLQKKRNKVIHGPRNVAREIINTVTQEDIRLAVKLATNSFSAFAFLHNRYCSVEAPPLPVPALTQSEISCRDENQV